MVASKVIVFGPTGDVGSTTALTAHSLGSHVVLAMRDTSKAIPGLSSSEESAGNYTRVSADLNKPETISAAVSQTGAKHAFIYLSWTSPDAMRSTIEAFKSSGIEFVVFLSSFTVMGDIRQIQSDDIISYAHARVEINLEEVFGPRNFVAVRPGSFAKNNLQYLRSIHAGEVKVWTPEAMVDNIVPEDIGRVAGTILAKGVPADGNTTPYLLGPRLMRQDETITALAMGLGKSPKVGAATREEALKSFIEDRHFSEARANYMLDAHAQTAASDGLSVFGRPAEESWLTNVQTYSGFKPTTFEEWVEKSKHTFP